MNDSQVVAKSRQSVFEWDGDGVQYVAYCIAPDQSHDTTGWSFKNLSRENKFFGTRLAQELSVRGARKVFAPAVAHSSMIIAERKHISNPIYLPFGVMLLRNMTMPADGVPIEPGEGYAGSFAGCGCLVAAGGTPERGFFCIPIHASRDGLTGEVTVVDSIANFYQRRKIPLNKVSLRMLFTIDGKIFTHELNHPVPKYAEKNKRMRDFLHQRYGPEVMCGDAGELYLERIVEIQARRYGFKQAGSAKTIRHGCGLVTTREDGMKDSRNLVLVLRKK